MGKKAIEIDSRKPLEAMIAEIKKLQSLREVEPYQAELPFDESYEGLRDTSYQVNQRFYDGRIRA